MNYTKQNFRKVCEAQTKLLAVFDVITIRCGLVKVSVRFEYEIIQLIHKQPISAQYEN